MPFAYLLRCRDGSLYAGATTDLDRRLAQHLRGTASAYTRSRRPVELAWSCEVETWSEALREEDRIRKLPKKEKEALVAGQRRRKRKNPE